MLEFVFRTKILARFLLRLFTYRLNLSWLGDVVASLGWKEKLGYLTAGRPPALDLDLTLFISNLEDFLVDANIITQKEDHFDRRVREIFHKVNEKMGTRRVSANFRLFLLIFGYFRNRFIKYKKSISHF